MIEKCTRSSFVIHKISLISIYGCQSVMQKEKSAKIVQPSAFEFHSSGQNGLRFQICQCETCSGHSFSRNKIEPIDRTVGSTLFTQNLIALFRVFRKFHFKSHVSIYGMCYGSILLTGDCWLIGFHDTETQFFFF